MTQKNQWHVARAEMLQDRVALPKEESDAIGEERRCIK